MATLKQLPRELLPHAVWRIIEWIGDRLMAFAGAGVIALAFALMGWIRKNLDIVAIMTGFVVSLAVLVWAGRSKTSISKSENCDSIQPQQPEERGVGELKKEIEGLIKALQLERSHWDSWRTAGKLDVLGQEARTLADRLAGMRKQAMLNKNELPEALEFPLSRVYARISTDQWLWFHHQTWKFDQDFVECQEQSSHLASSVKSELATMLLPSKHDIGRIISILKDHAEALSEHTSAILSYR